MKIIVFRSPQNRQWYFRFVARNGKKIAQSEGYQRKRSAIATLRRILHQARGARIVVESHD